MVTLDACVLPFKRWKIRQSRQAPSEAAAIMMQVGVVIKLIQDSLFCDLH